MGRMVIDDRCWSKLQVLLPAPKGRRGNNDRLFLEEVCWSLRTGALWRDLSKEYGSR